MSLHDALAAGNIPKARRLICRRAGINTPDETGETPLMHCALRPGREYLTQLLLTASADVDAVNDIGETALMLALQIAGNRENVILLLRKGSDINQATRYGYSAHDYALKHAEYDWLFPENAERRIVREKIAAANAVCVENFCSEQSIDANLRRFLLFDAVYSEDLNKAELLLNMGAPADCPSLYGWTTLMQAACRAHLELVKLLLRYGANPDYQDHEGRTALSEMKTCVPGLMMTELIYSEEWAVEVLGKKRLGEIKAAQGEIERLLKKSNWKTL